MKARGDHLGADTVVPVNLQPFVVLRNDSLRSTAPASLTALGAPGPGLPLDQSSSDPAFAAATPAFISEQVTAARRFYHYVGEGAQHQTGLTVVCGGWEECAEDYVIDRPSFPYLSLEFVAAGEGEVRLAGNSIPLNAGTVFCYGPGISQMIRTSAHRRLRKYFVDFVGTEGTHLLRECGLEPGGALQLSSTTDMRDAFDTLLQFAHLKHEDIPRLCALQLEIILRLTRQSTQPTPGSERRARATFERCRQQIDEHFIKFRTLQNAADACHIDVSYLCRLFHRFHAERPFHYLQRRKMEWAAQRLRGSGLLIREVADELGIEAFQFSRTFKRIHGASPSTLLSARSR